MYEFALTASKKRSLFSFSEAQTKPKHLYKQCWCMKVMYFNCGLKRSLKYVILAVFERYLCSKEEGLNKRKQSAIVRSHLLCHEKLLFPTKKKQNKNKNDKKKVLYAYLISVSPNLMIYLLRERRARIKQFSLRSSKRRAEVGRKRED